MAERGNQVPGNTHFLQSGPDGKSPFFTQGAIVFLGSPFVAMAFNHQSASTLKFFQFSGHVFNLGALARLHFGAVKVKIDGLGRKGLTVSTAADVWLSFQRIVAGVDLI